MIYEHTQEYEDQLKIAAAARRQAAIDRENEPLEFTKSDLYDLLKESPRGFSTIKEYYDTVEEIINGLREMNQDKINKHSIFPVSEVIFFKLVNGKYITSNGTEVTTEFMLKYKHCIFNDDGYVILKKM